MTISDDTLEACLTLLVQGVSVDECLRRYPEQQESLYALLATGARLREQPILLLSPAARARARAQMHSALRRQQRNGVRWRSFRLALATLVIALMLAAGTLGLSQVSNPGDALYALKLQSEEWRLHLSDTAEGRARLHLLYAQRRAAEVRTRWQATGALDGQTLAALQSEYQAAQGEWRQLGPAAQAQLGGEFSELVRESQSMLQPLLDQPWPDDQLALLQGALAAGDQALHDFQSPLRLPAATVTPGPQTPTATPVPDRPTQTPAQPTSSLVTATMVPAQSPQAATQLPQAAPQLPLIEGSPTVVPPTSQPQPTATLPAAQPETPVPTVLPTSPPTAAPPTAVPPTAAPSTAAPPTAVPPTAVPPATPTGSAPTAMPSPTGSAPPTTPTGSAPTAVPSPTGSVPPATPSPTGNVPTSSSTATPPTAVPSPTANQPPATSSPTDVPTDNPSQ